MAVKFLFLFIAIIINYYYQIKININIQGCRKLLYILTFLLIVYGP